MMCITLSLLQLHAKDIVTSSQVFTSCKLSMGETFWLCTGLCVRVLGFAAALSEPQ